MASSIYLVIHILGQEWAVEIAEHGIDLLIFLLPKLSQEKIASVSALCCLIHPRRNKILWIGTTLCYDREQNCSAG